MKVFCQAYWSVMVSVLSTPPLHSSEEQSGPVEALCCSTPQDPFRLPSDSWSPPTSSGSWYPSHPLGAEHSQLSSVTQGRFKWTKPSTPVRSQGPHSLKIHPAFRPGSSMTTGLDRLLQRSGISGTDGPSDQRNDPEIQDLNSV